MIAKIKDNQYVYIDQLTSDLEELLYNHFSAKDPKSFYIKNNNWDGVYRRYSKKYQRLPLPLLNSLKKLCAKKNIPLDIQDNRDKPKYPAPNPDEIDDKIVDGITLESWQLDGLKVACNNEIGIYDCVTGSGKCLGKDTPVLMHDGSIKLSQDIKVGDVLMGDDSNPRNVLSVCSGNEKLYKVKQEYGDDYIVNSSHILSLIKGKKKYDVSIKDYLESDNKDEYFGYKVKVDYENKFVPIDPYILGLWIGGCISDDFKLKTSDSNIIKHFNYVNKSKFNEFLIDYNLFDKKYIPDDYKYNSIDNRIRLIIGFIDSKSYHDNNGKIHITHVRDDINCFIEDMFEVIRSVGIKCYMGDSKVYNKLKYDCMIIDHDISSMKYIDDFKVNNYVSYNIEVEELECGDYFGFEIDGNKRFLLGDFTVTHNTEIMCGLVKIFRCPTLVIVEQIIVLDQIVERLRLRNVVHNNDIGKFASGSLPNGNIVIIGSIQSLNLPKKPNRKSKPATKDQAIRDGIELAKAGNFPDHFPEIIIKKVHENPENVRKLKGTYLEALKEHIGKIYHEKNKLWYKKRLENVKKIRESIKNADMLIVDECDRCSSDLYKDLFYKVFNGRRRYGFSGTVFDNKTPHLNLFLKSRLGSVIKKADRREVTKAGRIIPIKYYMKTFGEDGDKFDKTTYDIAEKEIMIHNPKFHDEIKNIILKFPKDKNMIIVDTCNIELLGKALEKHIPDSAFIFGKTSKKKRMDTIKKFEDGELQTLIGSKILKRGLDLKGGVNNLILCGGGSKKSNIDQIVGRSVRKNDKGYARIFDFLFLNNFYLYKHSRNRLKDVNDMGYETTVIFSFTKIDGRKFVKSRFRIPKNK